MTAVTWILALSTAAVLIFGPWYIRRDIRRAKLALEFRERFQRCAAVILDDTEAPAEAIHLIEQMWRRIDSPEVIRSFLIDAFSGELRKVVKEKRGVGDLWQGLPPRLREAFHGATMNFLFAVSFSATFTGPLVRRVLLIFAKEARSATAAVTTWEVRERPSRHARHCQQAA